MKERLVLTTEAAIERSRDSAETIAITYLGQVGFLFQHRRFAVLIDPYLTFSGGEHPAAQPEQWQRNYPPPVTGSQLQNVDLVLCTHDHLDHTDPTTLRAIATASPAAAFAGPHRSVEAMQKGDLASARVRALDAGDSFDFGPVTVEAVAAAHEDYERDADGHAVHLSYILRWAGCTFFHAGDTTAQEQLSSDLEGCQIDIGFLPINGRDDERRSQDIVGNMNSAEAAAFASRHAFGLLVPTHFDLYSNNGACLIEFMQAVESQEPKPCFKVFRPGEQLFFPVRGQV